MPTDPPPDAVFVYGTLLPGHLRWSVLGPYVSRHRPATVRGRLYDTGLGFPAADFADDGAWIDGVVCELHRDTATAAWSLLDEVEGPLYERRMVTLQDGSVARSYQWSGATEDLRPLGRRWLGD